MKVEIFKQTFQTYDTVLHHESNSINRNTPQSLDIDNIFGEVFSSHNSTPPTKKHPLFVIKKTTKDEESYLENYGNPMASVTKLHAMVVVEKTGDKVALKLFHGMRHRRAGNTWFKVSWNVDYISVNTKTGDVYVGYLKEYQKKIKCKKKIRRNFFSHDPISSMKSMIKNVVNSYVSDKNIVSNVAMEAISKFMFEIDNRDDFEKLDFNQRLFRFYLNKRQIKYPNNFQVFAQHLVGPEIRKSLKKNGNRLVDAFMERQKLSGKILKKSLHNCRGLNLTLYQNARDLFGDDWLNQDEGVITQLLDSIHNSVGNIPVEFKSLISIEELRRVYSTFKRAHIDGTLDTWTFRDHVRMYTELRLYGENDVRWMAENNREEFRQEHLDWTDKLQFYKQGNYNRIYPQYFVDMLQNKIGDYIPVLLTNSREYNEESSTQSNCVKTYIGKPASFIISLRNGVYGDRATLEYYLSKTEDKVEVKRVQSLGKYNNKLGEEWNEVLFKLDKIVVSSVKDKRFETVQITKECKNGVTLSSDSYWDHGNKLRWTHKNIDSGPASLWRDIVEF
jgi:hypothetical protein